MKKLVTLVAVIMATLCSVLHAQNYITENVSSFSHMGEYLYCRDVDSLTIVKDCQNNALWEVGSLSQGILLFQGYADEVTIRQTDGPFIQIQYIACGENKIFFIRFAEPIPKPWDQDVIWITVGNQYTLEAPNGGGIQYYQWNDGSAGTEYTVTNPENSGDISITLSNDCESQSDTIGVYYKSEIEMVSVDPYTDHIELTWDVNPYMAGYLESIEIYRDNYLIATVPYEDGQYIDDGVYGSQTSRTYKCKSISKNGFTSPYGLNKPSIHMVYLIDAFNRLVMEANDVSNYYDKLTQYYVALMQENGEMLIIDSISVNKGKIDNDTKNNVEVTRDGILRYTAGMEYINGSGFPVFIANLRDGRGKQMYSNVGANEIVGLPEPINNGIKVYPNPAKDRVTIEGTGKATITNALGQTILTKEIDGKATIELPRGMYFVKMNGVTRKIVVE